MSTLVILLCFVAVAKAVAPFMDAMNIHVSTVVKLLNETETSFYEESIPSLENAWNAIINIYNESISVDQDIQNEVRYERAKANKYLIEPARKNGINITECNKLYDELHNAQETISTQVTTCTDNIIESTFKQFKNIKKLADQVKSNFRMWRAVIHSIPSTVNDYGSLDIATAKLGPILDEAKSFVDNNYLPNLRANSNRVEELKIKHRECFFKPNEIFLNYENKYSSFSTDNQKCIQRLKKLSSS